MSRANRIEALLGAFRDSKQNLKEPLTSQAQRTYLKKLHLDIERTTKFIHQAKQAITKLKQPVDRTKDEKDECNETTDFHQTENAWSEETSRKAHLLALHEVYRQLPYVAIKDDLIGIATATIVTTKAVKEHDKTSRLLEDHNKLLKAEMALLRTVEADYKDASGCLLQRLKQQEETQSERDKHSLRVQRLITETDEKIALIRRLRENARQTEETLNIHLQRVVVKLHAMMDWENTNFADEETFNNNIIRSVSFLKALVVSQANGEDRWTMIVNGTPEDQLAKVMIQHKMLKLKSGGTYEVKLRNYI